jgi:hypothetical protein
MEAIEQGVQGTVVTRGIEQPARRREHRREPRVQACGRRRSSAGRICQAQTQRQGG